MSASDNGAGACQRCKGVLGESHYLQQQAKGPPRTVCVACHGRLMTPTRLKGWEAGLRCLFAGLAAALVCGLLACLPMAFLGWDFAIVWVFLGAAVGLAVKAGSEDRGNWYYRLIGVGSTWCAIGLSWLFCFLIWMVIGFPKDTEDKSGPVSKTALVSLFHPGQASPSPTPTPAVSSTPQAAATPRPEKADVEKKPSPLAIVLLLALPVIVVLGAPILVMFASPISILIYLLALHTAWRTTARESRQLEGPISPT